MRILSKELWFGLWDIIMIRVVSLVGLTALGGYCWQADAESFQWSVMLAVLVGTCFLAAAGKVANQTIEYKEDALMNRTAHRQIPQGKIKRWEASLWSATLLLISIPLLSYAHIITCALALLSFGLYVGVYSIRKRTNRWNITVGSIVGALPPLWGAWAANGVGTTKGWISFMVLFLWQYPHFFALVKLYENDYEKVGYKMFPKGKNRESKILWEMLISQGALLIVASFIYQYHYISLKGYIIIQVLNIAWTIPTVKDLLAKKFSIANARKILWWSIWYLPIWFAVVFIFR